MVASVVAQSGVERVGPALMLATLRPGPRESVDDAASLASELLPRITIVITDTLQAAECSRCSRGFPSLHSCIKGQDAAQGANSCMSHVDPDAKVITATLDLYDESPVNSVRYRERGHSDDWAFGDVYIRRQVLPDPAPARLEIAVSYQ